VAKDFYLGRKKEIEEVIQMLQDRVDAERMYASRLHKIGTRA